MKIEKSNYKFLTSHQYHMPSIPLFWGRVKTYDIIPAMWSPLISKSSYNYRFPTCGLYVYMHVYLIHTYVYIYKLIISYYIYTDVEIHELINTYFNTLYLRAPNILRMIVSHCCSTFDVFNGTTGPTGPELEICTPCATTTDRGDKNNGDQRPKKKTTCLPQQQAIYLSAYLQCGPPFR